VLDVGLEEVRRAADLGRAGEVLGTHELDGDSAADDDGEGGEEVGEDQDQEVEGVVD